MCVCMHTVSFKQTEDQAVKSGSLKAHTTHILQLLFPLLVLTHTGGERRPVLTQLLLQHCQLLFQLLHGAALLSALLLQGAELLLQLASFMPSSCCVVPQLQQLLLDRVDLNTRST